MFHPEEARRRALEKYPLVDADAEAAFDRLVWMATRMLGAPVAVMGIVDEERCWLKAAVGTEVGDVPASSSFAARVVAAGEPLVVSGPEEPFAEGEALGDTSLCVYAGAPLVVEASRHAGESVAIGALCVMDTELSTSEAEVVEALEALAATAVDALELCAARMPKKPLVEDIADAFFTLDAEWRFTYANRRAEELLERSREELSGQSVWEEFPEAVGSAFHEQYRKVLEEQATVHFEAYYGPLDTWFKVKAYPLEQGMAVYFDDVTPRKKAEMALRKRERQFQLLFRSNPLPMWVYDQDTLRFLAVNDAAVEHYGYSRDDFLSMRITDIRPADEVDRLADYLEQDRPALRKAGDWRHQRADGTVIDVEITSSDLTFDGQDAVLVVAKDVTERRAAEKALRERERYLSITLDSIGDAVITTDAEGRVMRMNGVAERLTGWTQSEAAGRPLPDIFHIINAQTGEPVENPVAKVLRQGKTVGLANHTALLAEDGARYQIADSAAPIRADNGEILGVVMVFRDVTEAYERREALRRSKMALEEAQHLAQTGNAEFDLATGRFELSSAAARILGLEANTTYPLNTFLDLIHPDDRPRMEKAIDRAIETGEPFRLEYRVIPAGRKDERWIRGRARVLRDEAGRITGVFGVITDITEQKRQASLVRRFGRVLDASVNEIYLFEEHTLRFIQVSKGGQENLGYTMEELRAMTPLDLKPFDRERFEEILQPLCEGTQEQVIFETTHRRKDGSTYPVEVRLQRSRQETPPVFIAIVLDITERRAAKEALERSLRRNRQIVQTTMDGYLLHDMDGAIIDVNPAYADMVGYRQEELTRMNVKDLSIHLTEAEVKQHVEHLVDVGQQRFETQHRSRGGQSLDVEISASYMEEGERGLINVFVRDISDRKKAEEALRQSEERYRTLVERSHDAIYIYRGNRLLFVNRRTCELTGYSEDELLSIDVFELIHPDDRTRVRRIARQRADGAAPSRYEARLLRADGTVRHGEFSVQAITYQGEYAAIGSIRDVTERKEMEETLRRRENKVQALYEAMGALTLTQTSERVAEQIQALIVDTLHYSISAVRYVRDEKLVPIAVSDEGRRVMPERPDYAVAGETLVAKAFRAGETAGYGDLREIDTVHPLGPVQAVAYVPIGNYGIISVASTEVEGINPFDVKLVEILARNAESVLERIEREEALREARDEAEEMNRLKSAFLANMSHEIRTPLTSIIGFAEVLDEKDLGEANTFTRLIQRGGQRLLDTLNSVLDLSQLEAGSMELTPERVDVAREIQDGAELFTPQARDKGILLTMDVPDEPVEAYLDAAALRRILSNLLSNAVKFTRTGDRVDVRLRPARDHVTIEVEDTGIGIDEAFLPDLFDAFKQESTGNARAFEGSGLGLAITHQLVHLMNGDIRVASEKGQGTRFTVQLPREMGSGERGNGEKSG